MIPVFQSLTGADQKQAEINKQTNENNALKQQLANKESRIISIKGIFRVIKLYNRRKREYYC